ncbi:MAG TPA: gliding motility protein GldM [Cytophagaceae bacterium]
MAGGKETPRQKMIGMMYLVLTALLALQVSSAIIQKFKFLDDSLMHVNSQTITENGDLEKRIAKAVADNGNKPHEQVYVKNAEEVRKKTDAIISRMNKLRDELIQLTGGTEEDGNYKGGKNEDEVAILMIGPEGSKSGEGYKLKDELNQYADFLTKITNNQVKVPKLALDGKEDPMFKNDKEQAGKDFAQLNFAQTPMVAALAVLAQKQSEILKYENEVLSHLAAQVGAADLKFDQVIAMVRPASKVVAAGTKYEAEMFLAASASTITPTMTARGQSIPVDPKSKLGKVSFTASASSYDSEGMSKQKWEGTVTFKFKGQDTTFKVIEEYFVAKPVIQVQSASVQALYRNCGNELNVQVPALGSTYNPSFTATGAKVVPGKGGIVTVIPTGSSVRLNVSSNGNAIGYQDFKVRLIPKPEIQAVSNGKPVDEKKGMAAPGPRSIVMQAIPDESFKAFLPKDARYRVVEWECILVRGKRPVSTQRFTSATGNLSAFAAQAQPGDRILIEVKKVLRTNFLNQDEEVNLGTIIKNIPLN